MGTGKDTAVPLIGMLPRLRRYARVLTAEPEAADDLVAAALSRARDAARDTAGQSSVLSVMAIMRRLDHSRRNPADAPQRAVIPPTGAAAPGDISEALSQLSVDEREILMLVAVERLTYDEVASLLEVPPATVMARLSRARANLRALTGPLTGHDV
jgi:RNA polymerase sigma-70 factor (ECF subfamily)